MDFYPVLLILHLFGVAVGAGGAFTSDALFLASLRNDKKLDATELRLLHAAGRVVWAGLGLLFVSGLTLLWLDGFSLLASSAFQAKFTIVGIITLNGVAFHRVHLPFLRTIFTSEAPEGIPNVRRRSFFVFISGALSSVSWISVIVLGFLRVLPFSYAGIMGVYLLAIFAAVPGALLVKHLLFPRLTPLAPETQSSDSPQRAPTLAVVLAAAFTAALVASLATYAFTAVRDENTNQAGNRTDTAIALTPKAELAPAPTAETHIAYAPEVPPEISRSDQRIVEVHLEILEHVCEIDSTTGTRTETWGYRIAGDEDVRCGAPGPVLRARVGDVLRVTLTNLFENTEDHDIDFHAVTGPGGGAKALSVAPGETATIEARLLYPGVFMYHCAHGDPPKHVTYGMYGMIIVDPEAPLPPADHEWAVMQSEWYLTDPDETGLAAWDRNAVLDEEPRFVTLNGRTDALIGDRALTMRTGERARIYFVNQGLNLSSNFHPIGSHWDIVYPEGATHPANHVIHGSQSTLVVAGGGSVAELVARVPGNIILVDHALSRAFYKGALGIIAVHGEADAEVFETFGEQHMHEEDEAYETEGSVLEITMNAGNYFYSVEEIRAQRGERVRIRMQNVGGTHDLVIDELNVQSEETGTGETAVVEFTADTAGTFTYYCSVGRHRERGQWGTLIVEE